MVTFCTIVRPADFPQARVMAASVKQHHPEADVLVAILGNEPPARDEPYEIVEVAQSAPELLSYALSRAEQAVYIGPEVRVYGSLEPVLSTAAEAGVAVLPRLESLPDDTRRPSDADLLAAGAISPALVAVTRGDGPQEFLSWWSRSAEGSEATDGRWLELALVRFPFVKRVEDPGCNVSFWNLHERPLERDGHQVLAGGAPLRFFHFDGFRPDRPYWLSDDATRVRVVDSAVLSDLCGSYSSEVIAAGWVPPRRQIGDLQRLGNGQRIDHLVRALWSEMVQAGPYPGDPLSALAADSFVGWMREPADHGGSAGVNRYLYAAYLTRPDLQREFPDLDGGDGVRLIEWAWEHGRKEVFSELLPAPANAATAVAVSPLGVNVIGYLGETLGLAEAARLYVQALHAAGVPVSTTAVTPDLPIDEAQKSLTRYGSRGYENLRSPVEPTFNLACLNGDHLAELVRVRGPEVLGGRPTIGQWGWETDVLPPTWSEAFDLVEEVWVYSTFMAENLGRLLPVPVVVIPPAVVAPDPTGAELPIARDDRFTFVFMLDFFSTMPRKNALGLVDAFTRAFAPGEGPRLIIKTINARFRELAADELRFRAGGHPDIEFFDGYLDPAQKALLLQRADCYVSLHRSEGFGLPLAESMALGTPVIATGYSGNTDFTTPANSYLVDYQPTHVGPDVEIYPADGTWAEPDLDHAAELLRYVSTHRQEAAAKGARAQADIRRDYAPEVVGSIARARLERLRDLSADRSNGSGLTTLASSLGRLENALRSFDLQRGVQPAPRGAGGLLRRGVLRMMLPFTFHEREVDRELFEAVRALGAELGHTRTEGERDRVRLHRLEDALRQAQSHAASVPGNDPENV